MFGASPGTAGTDAVIGVGPGSAEAGHLALQEGRELAEPTAVRLRCGHGGVAGGSPRIDNAQLTAFRTDALQVQPG